MKNNLQIVHIIIVIFTGITLLHSQLYATEKPEPFLPERIEFPEYTTHLMSNGLKVFVIENHEQPLFAFRMLIGGGKSVEEGRSGLAEMAAALIHNCAGDCKNSKNLDELDFTGTILTADATNDYISINGLTLKKFAPEILKILKQIVTDPDYDNESFNNLKRYKHAEQMDRLSNPDYLAEQLANIISFGPDYPYSYIPNEDDYKDLKLEMVEEYYKTYFVPGNTTLMIVGDIDDTTLIGQLDTLFGDWKPKSKKEEKENTAIPFSKGVHFIHRPGSVNSEIMFVRKAVPINDRNYESLEFITDIIYSGLYQDLRNRSSFSYAPYSYITGNRLDNLIEFGASVNSSKTDSAIIAVQNLMKSLEENFVNGKELENIVDFKTGKFYMSLEEMDKVATLLQDADFYKIDPTYYENYSQNLLKQNQKKLHKIFNLYLSGDFNIIVVADPSVRPQLEKFGTIYDYNTDLQPLSGDKIEKISKLDLTVESLLAKYTDAIGGMDNLEKIATLTDSAQLTLKTESNESSGTAVSVYARPGKRYYELKSGSNNQVIVTNGIDSYFIINGVKSKADNKNQFDLMFTAKMFRYTNLHNEGFNCSIEGGKEGKIVLKAVSPNARVLRLYFNSRNFLLEKVESETAGPKSISSTEYYNNYTEYNGVMLPAETISETGNKTTKYLHKYFLNQEVNSSLFAE